MDIPPFPEYILIQTASYCNAGCLICPYQDTVRRQEQGYMEADLYAKIIEELSCRSGSVKQIMPYLMNEPLCDKHIDQKINLAASKNPNAHIHLVTNGMLLDHEFTEKILQSGLTSIKISMLGHREETYTKVMGVRNFEKVFHRIVRFSEKALKLKRKDYLTISFTNTPEYVSAEEIEEARAFWAAMGIVYEVFHHPISRAGNVKNLGNPSHQAISGCDSIWWDQMIHILFNGDVVLCCMDWQRRVVLGNVKRHSIEDIWNSRLYKKTRKMVLGKKKAKADFICYRCESARVKQ